MKKWFNKHLKQINLVLLGLIIIVNGYVLLAPLLPAVQYHVAQATTEPLNVDSADELADVSRDSNHLIIPRLRLDKPIWYGDNPKLVNKGVWHVPGTSTPDQGSNTVLVGHRYTYKNPAIFYSLDKVELDDPLVMVWDGKIYVYKVTAIDVVAPDNLAVHNPTEDSRLTVYTCTPLWSNKKRLVITGSLEKVL